MKANEAYNAIKKIILKTDPADSYVFSENYFSETLNMSRTPVRAALQRLQFEGLITIIPHQGIVVREVTYEEAWQLFDLRAVIENYLIHKAVGRLNEDDFNELEKMIQDQQQAIEEKDYDAYLDLDEEFHIYMYHHYKNDEMIDIVRRYKARTYRIHYKSISAPGRAERSLKMHRQMIQLLREGKTQEMIEVLEMHRAELEKNPKRSHS